MKNKLPVLFALCMALAGSAQALDTEGLIALTEMPVVVADVTAQPNVPQAELITFVTTLNRAAVPAPQFIEVVRYAPVAIADRTQPEFVTYVTQQYDQGIVGEPLALAIADRYESIGVRGVDFKPVAFDALSLIAMPLAVAAVADLVDVPRSDLMTLIASLNQAQVPPTQFIEVVRYSPVVLVDRTEAPQFVRFVTTEVDRGVVGRPLAIMVADRLRDNGADIDVITTREVIAEPIAVTRNPREVRVAKTHPHGGPPGQLKKQRGLQTGAEVVHGTKPGRTVRVVKERQVAPPVVISRPRHGGGEGHTRGRGNDGGGGPGKGNGQGKGKGKGKG